jgi:hypothetical protein
MSFDTSGLKFLGLIFIVALVMVMIGHMIG